MNALSSSPSSWLRLHFLYFLFPFWTSGAGRPTGWVPDTGGPPRYSQSVSPSNDSYPELVTDSSLVLSLRSHSTFKLGLLIFFSFVGFLIYFFQLEQNCDSPQTHLPFHHQRPVLGWPWPYSEEKPCILCTLYHTFPFCLVEASVATPCFSQEPRVQSVFNQPIDTNYIIIFKIGYVQLCITVPIPECGTPRSRGCKNPSSVYKITV